MSFIHRSRFEHEFQHSQMGAGTSNEASERSRPATTSGEEILLIPPIARLTEPPRRLSTESFLRTSNPRSVLTESDLSDIRGRYGFPNEVQLRLPFKGERADTVSEGWICMYTIYFECGLRLPLPPLLVQTMHHYNLAIPQLMPNGMRVFLGLIVLAEEAGVELTVDDVLEIYYPQENFKDHGRYSMYPRRKKQVVGEMKNADRYWQDRYFFMHVNEKSMGDLANAFYPLWGTLRKELKKPPPKALLFEEKLERLLALPNREWDDIQVPKRLGASSLWKDFVELPSGIPKRVPSWVDWPFIIRGALRRLFGTPLLVDPLTDEEALITEFALDLSPEPDVEGPRVEVVLPPRLSLLNDRLASVDIARQLLSEVDAETLTQNSLQDHMDDIMWETMKINVRTTGLFHRLADKVVSQSNKIKELEENDSSRRAKLQDIERKFVDVKTGSEGLMLELQKSMDVAREDTSAMDALVRRFEESQEKNYKAGLLDEAQIDEEIEMFKEDYPKEVRSLSSVPALATTEAEPSNVEPPAQANLSEVRET
ncbi:hypothetical protein TIFTF001_044374 [Ficus carica]|uniref:Transposase (putative) gypsy type domain-containing protein n=1 Tax=Ficus carica TaxID=3494 RepID=A0AA87ZUS4_FICCA|nr:hypothetical protein TIFTF001_044373 [Ficus carica]GMN29691.1 hypothetical protein TIFTF001_044374 [Ficus carica]